MRNKNTFKNAAKIILRGILRFTDFDVPFKPHIFSC